MAQAKGGEHVHVVSVKKETQPMRRVVLEKVTVNMGLGEAGEKLAKAEKVLESLVNQKPVRTLAKDSVRDWAIRKNSPIGIKATLRGAKALDFLKRAFEVKERRLPYRSFTHDGLVSFGIADHTDFEGQRYNPEIGVFGMDVAISLARPGYRVKRRRVLAGRVHPAHRVTREEAVLFLRDNFTVEVVE